MIGVLVGSQTSSRGISLILELELCVLFLKGIGIGENVIG